MLLSQNALSAILLVGLGIVLLLAIRNIFATRQVLTLLNEQSLAVQKLSAEVFEMQNGHSETTRSIASATQALARVERELQAVGAGLTVLRTASPASANESMVQFGKEIKRVLQTKEVSDFLENQGQGGR